MGYYIDIKVSGNVDGVEIKPETFDIRHLAKVLQAANDLIGDRSNIEESVYLEIVEGSVVSRLHNILRKAFVASMAVLASASTYSLDGLERKQAEALLSLQKLSSSIGVRIDISNNDPDYRDCRLTITPETSFKYSEDILVDTQLYLYGTIISAGGKSPNIHLEDDNGDIYIISIPRATLASMEENMLYKYYEVEVRAKQSLATGDINRKDMELISYRKFDAKRYSVRELEELAERATAHWASQGLTGDQVLAEIRGDD